MMKYDEIRIEEGMDHWIPISCGGLRGVPIQSEKPCHEQLKNLATLSPETLTMLLPAGMPQLQFVAARVPHIFSCEWFTFSKSSSQQNQEKLKHWRVPEINSSWQQLVWK